MPVSPWYDCYAITAPGLEVITRSELERLGVTVTGGDRGGVQFRADLPGVYGANLHLRTASRVLIRIGEFQARTFGELERRANHLPWVEYLRDEMTIRFRVTAHKSRLNHGKAVAERLMAGAVRRVAGLRVVAPSGEAEPEVSAPAQDFVVRIVRDHFTVSVDSSGELLHRRGYRQATSKAPLRETLAAAMLLAAEWDGTRPLVDPFAGSGTIPIEAALLARRIPPGRHRSFAFERWPGFNGGTWDRLRSRADAAARPNVNVVIAGSDRDDGAIAAARANALRAEVGNDLTLERRPVSAVELAEGGGLVLTNPPYGARIGDRLALRNLYARLGQVTTGAGWQLGMLTNNQMLERATGVPLVEKWRTTNGGIPVRLMLS